MKRIGPRMTALAATIALLPFLYVHLFERPSMARDWSPDQSIVPRATFSGDTVVVANVRNSSYYPRAEILAPGCKGKRGWLYLLACLGTGSGRSISVGIDAQERVRAKEYGGT